MSCTDGSTIKDVSNSYGKTGAAAIIYESALNSDPIILKSNLGIQSNNYAAELEGIRLGLDYLNHCPLKGSVLFLVVCIPAITASFSLPVSRDYNKEVRTNLVICNNLIELF